MYSTTFWFWWFVFTVPVIAQGVFAYGDNFFWPSDLRIMGRSPGLPIIAHGGMWVDLFPFAPLMARIIELHHEEWELPGIVFALTLGLAASFLAHKYVYVPGGEKLPEAHTHDGRLTEAGWIHVVYMGCGLAVIGLFYIGTYARTADEIFWVGIILFVHTVVGTHTILRLVRAVVYLDWYPRLPIFSLQDAGTLAGAAVLLFGLSFVHRA